MWAVGGIGLSLAFSLRDWVDDDTAPRDRTRLGLGEGAKRVSSVLDTRRLSCLWDIPGICLVGG